MIKNRINKIKAAKYLNNKKINQVFQFVSAKKMSSDVFGLNYNLLTVKLF